MPADNASAAPTSAITELQQMMQHRIQLMMGGVRSFTYNDVQALIQTFQAPQAAFDYAFNLVVAGPHDQPQLALLVARAITEDYQTGIVGGKAYQRLADIVAVPSDQRPAGSDDFMFDACFQLRRAVEADLYLASTRHPDWHAAAQRRTPAIQFLVPYIHAHFPGIGTPYLQSHATTRAERMGHLLFVHSCWQHKPEAWGKGFCDMLMHEAQLGDGPDADAFNMNRRRLDDMVAEVSDACPHHVAGALLSLADQVPTNAPPAQLGQLLNQVEPLIYAADAEHKGGLGIRFESVVARHTGVTNVDAQVLARNTRHARRGLLRLSHNVRQHLLHQHAADTLPPFNLDTAQVTVDDEAVATRYGPRIEPQDIPLTDLQQQALRVKAERHCADLRNRHGLRRAMAHFATFAIN